MDFMINFSVLIPDWKCCFNQNELAQIGFQKKHIKLLQRSRTTNQYSVITGEQVRTICPDIKENQLKAIDFSPPFFNHSNPKLFRSKHENEILQNIEYNGTGSFTKFCRQFLVIINPNLTDERKCLSLLNTCLKDKALSYFHKIRRTKGFLDISDALNFLASKFGNPEKIHKLCSAYEWKDDDHYLSKTDALGNGEADPSSHESNAQETEDGKNDFLNMPENLEKIHENLERIQMFLASRKCDMETDSSSQVLIPSDSKVEVDIPENILTILDKEINNLNNQLPISPTEYDQAILKPTENEIENCKSCISE